LADDFNLDDFANTKENISSSPEKLENGYYIMNFLERGCRVYGSSKPGEASNYGIKMNPDKTTYDTSDEYQKNLNRTEAEQVFNTQIKEWFVKFVKSATIDEKIQLINEEKPPLIKANQLLRKMVVLECPSDLLGIYQEDTIDRACQYFVKECSDKDYFTKNKNLLSKLYETFNLDRTKENQLKITSFVWDYFNKKTLKNLSLDDEYLKRTFVEKHYAFVQLHPSYDYTDFVEGLRPTKQFRGNIGFKLKDGVFKEFCKNAKSDCKYIDGKFDEQNSQKYVVIIDEINRGEISKIFGELFFSIEPSYRGIDGKVKTQYQNMIEKVDLFYDGFYVPENVYIIGTMNDIDRSVESFDFAMRRRFTWKEIKATDTQEDMFKKENGTDEDWKVEATNRMNDLNNAIWNETEKKGIEGLNSSYHIGGAYFKTNLWKYDENEKFAKLWEYHLEPLLKEYLRGMSDAKTKLDDLKKAYENNG